MLKRYADFRVCFCFMVLVSLPSFGQALPSGDVECGRVLPEGANIGMYGPFDYYKPKEANAVSLVEHEHFTSDVETLRRGNTASDPSGDLRYTLIALPNHPRALQTLIRLARKEGTNRPKNMIYSVECYFDRAIRFRPDDAMVKMIYAIYLAGTKRYQDGKVLMDAASGKLSGSGNFHYNYALISVSLKEWDAAIEHAAIAYSLGFDLPGLRRKLSDAGRWEAVEREVARLRQKRSEQMVGGVGKKNGGVE